MKRDPSVHAYPLAWPTLLFAVGIWVGDEVGVSFAWGLGAAGMALAACLHSRCAALALPVALLFGGIARQGLATTIWAPHDLRRLLPSSECIATLRGTLAESPVTKTMSRGTRTQTHTSLQLNVSALRLGDAPWVAASGVVVASVRGELSNDFCGGREVIGTGVVSRPSEATTPGAFDYRAFLDRCGVHYQLQTSGALDWELVPSEMIPLRPWSDRFLAWARASLALGLSEEDPAVQLLWAMTLGWKPGLTHDAQEPFMRSGTLHVFAISGLHIALLTVILVEGLGLFAVPRHLAGAMVIPLIWLYTAATGWQSSAIRSTVMMTVVVGGWTLNRPGNSINSLAVAAAALLVWDSQQLFLAGFQLSFLVVLSLAWGVPKLEARLQEIRLIDSWIPSDRVPAWRRRCESGLRPLLANLEVAFAAWVGSMPLIAHYFHLLNPVSLLANLLIVPVSSIALASSVAGLISSLFWTWLAECFNHGSWFWMKLMVRLSDWAAHVPGGCFYVPSPGVAGFLIYYGALIGFFSTSPLLRHWRPFWITGLSLLALIKGLWVAVQISETHLVLLPRIGGATAWLDLPGLGENALIDCGDAGSVERVVTPFLKSRGVNRVANLMITHASAQRLAGAQDLEVQFPVRQRYAPLGMFRSPYLKRWKEQSQQRQSPVLLKVAGQKAGPWKVLHPQPGQKSASADDAPMVLQARFGSTRVLWLSSLNISGQALLLSQAEDLRAEIVIAGIPNRGEPLAEGLLDRIHPELIVITDAELPASSRASPSLIERLEGRTSRVIFMRQSGCLEINFKRDHFQVSPWKPGLSF